MCIPQNRTIPLKYPKLDYATIKSIRRHNKLPLKGDTRNLEGLLVDGIISSPPYAEMKQDDKRANDPAQVDKRAREFEKAGGNFHTPGRLRTIARHYTGYTEDKDNIGNLPYGQIDKIVTSPPYAEAKSAITDKDWLREHQDELSINSPSRHGAHQRENLHHERLIIPSNPSNIGNLTYGNIDAVVTSPPYDEGTGHGRGRSTELQETKGLYLHGAGSYSDNKENIGEMKGQSYLGAMLQVYQQCHKVLKPSGLMILVTKNFIRNKQVIRLDLDTIKLCEQAGFKLTEQHKRKLPSQSFWRIIYYQKHPEVEKLSMRMF